MSGPLSTGDLLASAPGGGPAGSPPILGVDPAALPPASADGPLDEVLPLVEDDPESLGSIGDAPESPELLEDDPESLGDMGGGIKAFAAPAPPESMPTPSPVANAALSCLIRTVHLPVRPRLWLSLDPWTDLIGMP